MHAATAPETWADPDALPLLQALLLFVGVPLGLVIVISLLAAAPAIARASRQRRDADAWAQPRWFGGPSVAAGSERRALGRGSAGAPSDAESGTPSDAGTDAGGGAGARW